MRHLGLCCLILSSFVLTSAACLKCRAVEPTIPVLKKGMKGGHVVLAQNLLNSQLENQLSVDGNFGSATDAAVRKFQTKHGLESDGIVGPQTWQSLRGAGPFQYVQSSGELSRDGVVWATGYSGRGSAKNDPQKENIKNQGPIPKGKWAISKPINSIKTGPFVLRLSPMGHLAHGRSAFQIHGDSVKKPGTASSGCIILSRHIREHIAASREFELLVVE